MSPIKNLTDTVQSRFPRLGKLHKGGEKVNGQYGPDLDHFRFTSESKEICAAFEEAYGKEPHAIQAYIPYATPQEAFTTWAEIWSATGLVHRCDGELMTVWLEKDKYVHGSKACTGGHEKGDYMNDAIGRLDIIVPELIEAGFVGYVTLETHSKHDILNILSVLQATYETRTENPLGLRGILFNLRRVQESITTPGFGNQAGKRSRVNKWLVRLEPVADWVRLQIEMANAAQMLPEGTIEGEVKELPATTGPSSETKAPPSTPPNDGNQGAEINTIGEQLYPGVWAAKKKDIAANFQTGGKADLAKVLKFLQGRRDDIKKPEQMLAHVKKIWPGYEAFLPLVATELKTKDFDRLACLRGIADAVKAKAEAPEIDNAIQLNIILAAISVESKIPEDFR